MVAEWRGRLGPFGRTALRPPHATDVSAVADPDTGVAVYDSHKSGGWAVYGGTSASSPIIAATYALAGVPAAGTYPSSYPYQHLAALHDVTSGRNGSCHLLYLCTARHGFDGPTGHGTPNGVTAFTRPDLHKNRLHNGCRGCGIHWCGGFRGSPHEPALS